MGGAGLGAGHIINLKYTYVQAAVGSWLADMAHIWPLTLANCDQLIIYVYSDLCIKTKSHKLRPSSPRSPVATLPTWPKARNESLTFRR